VSLVAAALVSFGCIGEQPLVSHDRCRGDCVNGHGRETTFWGRLKYEGTWRNGRAEGRGTEARGDERYEGEFREGTRWGDGVLVLRDGTRFEGRWLSGRRHGPFLVTGTSGVTERRHFYQDWEVRCVRGDCVSGDGRMEGPPPPQRAFFSWDGGFVDGLRHGPGTWVSFGVARTGTWSNDRVRHVDEVARPDGSRIHYHAYDAHYERYRGEKVWPDGRRFEGEFERDAETPKSGLMTWPDGARYQGALAGPMSVNDSNPCPVSAIGFTVCRKGHGKMTWSDGESWEGEWKGDRPSGSDAPARDYSRWPTTRAEDR
jgi:hypothetical protein